MIISDGTGEIEYNGKTNVAIGKFDGVHLGHRKLIGEAKAGKYDKTVVFTFSYSSPMAFKCEEKLLSEQGRRKAFEDLGVDYLIEYELNEITASMSAEDFVKEILVNRLHVGMIVAGCDVSFGHKGLGNAELLMRMGEEYGFFVKIIDKVKYNGEDISSSRIRDEIAAGNINDSNAMLGVVQN